MAKKEKSIVFDYDGVVADSLEQVIFRWNESARIYGNGVKVSKDLIRHSNTGSWRKFYQKTLGIPEEKVETASELFRQLGSKQGPPPLFDGVEKTVKELVNGFDLYIISSHYSSVIKRDLEFYKILNYFKDVIGYEEVGDVNKPDPRFILKFLSGWKLSPNEVIYAGDTSDEIECGKSAGVKTIGCTWGYQAEEFIEKSQPDEIAYKFSDLPAILNKF